MTSTQNGRPDGVGVGTEKNRAGLFSPLEQCEYEKIEGCEQSRRDCAQSSLSKTSSIIILSTSSLKRTSKPISQSWRMCCAGQPFLLSRLWRTSHNSTHPTPWQHSMRSVFSSPSRQTPSCCTYLSWFRPPAMMLWGSLVSTFYGPPSIRSFSLIR